MAENKEQQLEPEVEQVAATQADEQPEAEAVEQDLDELVEKAKERDEYLALAQRVQADFENFRKRAQKEASLAESRGVAKLAFELLPVIDNLDLALKTLDDEGVRLVRSQLDAALARFGVEGYSPEGEPFDPSLHEAMAQRAVEGAESGTVVEVYQQGYRLNGEVLRPAKVVVAE